MPIKSGGTSAPQWAQRALSEDYGFASIMAEQASGDPLRVKEIERSLSYLDVAIAWRHTKAREYGVGWKEMGK